MALHFNQRTPKEIAAQYAAVLSDSFAVKQVFLFGSAAKGNAQEDSDIDIAVSAENFSGDKVEDMFQLMKLRRNVDIRIEPHPFPANDFTEANPFAAEIIKTGIRIM